MTEEERLEALAELRASAGWKVFIEELAEARDARHADAVYSLSTAEDLYYLKGWTECADSILDATDSAAEMLKELSNERRDAGWH